MHTHTYSSTQKCLCAYVQLQSCMTCLFRFVIYLMATNTRTQPCLSRASLWTRMNKHAHIYVCRCVLVSVLIYILCWLARLHCYYFAGSGHTYTCDNMWTHAQTHMDIYIHMQAGSSVQLFFFCCCCCCTCPPRCQDSLLYIFTCIFVFAFLCTLAVNMQNTFQHFQQL